MFLSFKNLQLTIIIFTIICKVYFAILKKKTNNQRHNILIENLSTFFLEKVRDRLLQSIYKEQENAINLQDKPS